MGDESSIQWAIDLMTDKTDEKTSFLQMHRVEIGLAASIFASPMLLNMYRRVPWYTGFPQSVFYWMLPATACTLIATTAVRRTRNKRDARIIDYIRTYPERFPPPENKQYKDLFQPWIPVR
ncbi:NADH dehydrogenase (ubiquinone) B14.5 B subunit [Lasioglossum baleicum]|uniref:NADH dehydrogenase (ubiquinone) B14.5 B subunit n=1 Tax=Lasioglossum baleicum TaxID=434251 RepID=UPI003FCE9D0C